MGAKTSGNFSKPAIRGEMVKTSMANDWVAGLFGHSREVALLVFAAHLRPSACQQFAVMQRRKRTFVQAEAKNQCRMTEKWTNLPIVFRGKVGKIGPYQPLDRYRRYSFAALKAVIRTSRSISSLWNDLPVPPMLRIRLSQFAFRPTTKTAFERVGPERPPRQTAGWPDRRWRFSRG
ncbi:MAG: hypothetical protein ACU0DI_17340 [Paracoccaceae bacterium]